MRNHARKEEEKPTFLGISSAAALFCGISVLAHWNQSLHSSSRNIFSWYYKYKDHWNQTSEPLERCSAAGLVRDPAIVLASSRPRESPPPIRFRPLPTTNSLPPHKCCSPHHQFQTNNEKEISADFISIQISGPEFHKREEKLRHFQAHNSRPRSPMRHAATDWTKSTQPERTKDSAVGKKQNERLRTNERSRIWETENCIHPLGRSYSPSNAHIPMKLHSLFSSFFSFLAIYSQKWQLKNLGSALLHITSDQQLMEKMNRFYEN